MTRQVSQLLRERIFDTPGQPSAAATGNGRNLQRLDLGDLVLICDMIEQHQREKLRRVRCGKVDEHAWGHSRLAPALGRTEVGRVGHKHEKT